MDGRCVVNANAAGTVPALFCMTLIPWCPASAMPKRTLFVYSMERALSLIVLLFLSLSLLRWVTVLGLAW
jgi:hypothetical protein